MAETTERTHPWANCHACGREMLPGGGCAYTHTVFTSRDATMDIQPRIAFGHEPDDWGANDGPCHDCNAGKHQHHHAGCDAERCSRCQGQAISCFCIDEMDSITLALYEKGD